MAVTAETRRLTDEHRRAQIARARQVDAKVEQLWSRYQADQITAGQWERAMMIVAHSGYQSSRDLAAQYVDMYRIAAIREAAGKMARPELDMLIAGRIIHSISPADALAANFSAALAETRKLAMRGGRDMVASAALQDRRAVGWRRITDGDPCTFCAMNVGRGAVYKSANTAGAYANRRFVGPGQYKFHNHCGCSIEVLYDDWQPTDAELGWVRQYTAAADQAEAEGLTRDADHVLPIMRANGDFRDSPARRNKQPA